MAYKTMTVEEVYQLREEERLQRVAGLHDTCQPEKIIELLLSVGLENLDGKILSELARAYNNNQEFEMAMIILDSIPVEDRDAIWYYRYGYAHMQLSEDLSCDYETQSQKALAMLDKGVELAKDREIIEWCIELVSLSDLKKVLEEHYEKYPFLHQNYSEYVEKNIREMNEIMQSKKQQKYKKITLEDIQEIEDSWEIIEPVYNTVNIYDSYEEYLESAKTFTLEQRYLLAITWYFMEVNNGGHHQFFFNSTGIVWEDAINGFQLFDMKEYANNFMKVIDYFGGNIPFDRKERWDLLQKLEEENEEAFNEMLDQADDFVYDYEGEETELTYMKKNPEKFVFEGHYTGY
ncbi:DUF4375 domain-containing protein [Clostridiales bacterium COT073_COT-073]|nr:DUF4375 domain-containing protein [Clostridiales bacterium COT073_COT-073]